MKKYLLLVITILLGFFANDAKAQYYDNTFREDSWHITVGPVIGAVINPVQLNPNGTPGYVRYSRLSVGASVRAEYYPNPFVGLSLGTGVTTIAAKTKGIDNYLAVPVTAGVKAFFSQTMYLGAETGLGYASITKENHPDVTHVVKIVSPLIGYNNNDYGWDINLRYEAILTKNNYISMFGLHVAYSFDLSN